MIANGTGFLLQTMLLFANKSDKISHENTIYDFLQTPLGADSDPNQPRCYGVFGCFSHAYPWTTDTRQIAYYPESPSKINVKFAVYTQRKRYNPLFLDLNQPHETKRIGINPNGPIYVIAHGYMDSGEKQWILKMMNALLDRNRNVNSTVIVVDWGEGSSPPYAQAVSNIRLVGVITAHVLYMLYEELNMKNLDNVHMLGHSLGAHLSSYTGYTLQKNFGLQMGRITGMDPAEPLFTDSDTLVCLDKTDAMFVDVIHSDTLPITRGGLGMPNPIGHVDFYPNGGQFNPGCDAPVDWYIMKEKGSFFNGVQQFLSCNHLRSYQFMTESILSKCAFTAVTCESYEEFKEGRCFDCKGKDGHYCLQFGFNSQNSYQKLIGTNLASSGRPIKAYLMTAPTMPYCQTHYKVTVVMSSNEESTTHGGEIGILTINVNSDQNLSTGKMKFSEDPKYFEPGFEYSAVMGGKASGVPKSASINWEYKTNPLNPLTWRILTSPRVHIQHIIIETLEMYSKTILCPAFGQPVISGTPSEFTHEYCNVYQNY